jgi:hypothetical protein
VDTNSKGAGSYKVLDEVINQGPIDANSVKASGIFYDKDPQSCRRRLYIYKAGYNQS